MEFSATFEQMPDDMVSSMATPNSSPRIILADNMLAVAATVDVAVAMDPTAGRITVDSALCGQGNDQDYVYVGNGFVDGKGPCEIGAVFDGHGKVGSFSKRHFIEFVRAAPLHDLLVQDKPINALVSYFKQFENIYDFQTGSTAVIVRLFPETKTVEWWSVGDSTVAIYINGILHSTNPHHSPTNCSEMTRLNELFGVWRLEENMRKPLVISPTEITLGPGAYAHFPPKDMRRQTDYLQLALTQSLGHHDYTGYSVDAEGEMGEHGSLVYEGCDDVKVVLCSDGATDMLVPMPRLHSSDQDHYRIPDWLFMAAELSTATVIMEETVRRWGQEWIYVLKGYKPCSHQFSTQRGDRDDVGVVTMFVKGDPSIKSKFFCAAEPWDRRWV